MIITGYLSYTHSHLMVRIGFHLVLELLACINTD